MPDGVQIPTWVWWFIIKTVAVSIFAVGVIVVAIVWKTGRLPTFRGREPDRRIKDDEKVALLQIVKDNTAAMQALKSLGEDSKGISISCVDRLESLGKAMAALSQKLQDVHEDVRTPRRHAST